MSKGGEQKEGRRAKIEASTAGSLMDRLRRRLLNVTRRWEKLRGTYIVTQIRGFFLRALHLPLSKNTEEHDSRGRATGCQIICVKTSLQCLSGYEKKKRTFEKRKIVSSKNRQEAAEAQSWLEEEGSNPGGVFCNSLAFEKRR